jgi:hypothetical protein
LVADRAAANKGRQNFIAWAVALLQWLGHETVKTFSQDDLLAAWEVLPDTERRRVTTTKATSYFQTRCGVKLTMEELFDRAFPQESWAGDS